MPVNGPAQGIVTRVESPFPKPVGNVVEPQPPADTLTEPISTPKEFCSLNITLPLPVCPSFSTLLSRHVTPEGNVHLEGRKLSGFRTPKYARQLIESRTTII